MSVKKFDLTINGQSVSTEEYKAVYNPATGDVAGMMPLGGEKELDLAVRAARAAFPAWSTMPDAERKAKCQQISKILEKHAEELANLLTLEQGKPLNGLGSRWEVGGSIAWSAYTSALDLPVKVIEDEGMARAEIHRKPIGVVASITPWNYPLMIAIWHIVPALRAGNTVIIKPSEHTPLATLRMAELLNDILPAGVFNIVTGSGGLGSAISAHPDINKIVFTGSSPTGRKIMSSAAENLKRLTLELGGNDAAIVLADNDPKELAEKLFWGAFINNGQTCACIKRLYVHDSIYDAVCDEMTAYAAKVKTGNGLDETSQLGPLQNAMQYKIVAEAVEDAKKHNARILIGGNPDKGAGLFYPPTLVAGIKAGAKLVDEEQFGPALPIIRFSDVDTVIKQANNNPNGLGGSIWSRDTTKAYELAKRLECGTVWINNHGAIQPNAPFGGIKQSGIGCEFGLEGLLQNTDIQTIITG